MSQSPPLTAELQQQILASIRAGGYAHIAAQAWGVLEGRWRRWLAAGRRRGAREPYRSLYRLVRQAKAQARLKAEMAVLGKDPRFWLKNGPGKEADEAPGWATARAARTPAPADAIRQADLKRFMDTLRTGLADHAEALEVVDRLVGMPGTDTMRREE
jgi:hypothetical protein